jgi:hypothetical protein
VQSSKYVMTCHLVTVGTTARTPNCHSRCVPGFRGLCDNTVGIQGECVIVQLVNRAIV